MVLQPSCCHVIITWCNIEMELFHSLARKLHVVGRPWNVKWCSLCTERIQLTVLPTFIDYCIFHPIDSHASAEKRWSIWDIIMTQKREENHTIVLLQLLHKRENSFFAMDRPNQIVFECKFCGIFVECEWRYWYIHLQWFTQECKLSLNTLYRWISKVLCHDSYIFNCSTSIGELLSFCLIVVCWIGFYFLYFTFSC